MFFQFSRGGRDARRIASEIFQLRRLRSDGLEAEQRPGARFRSSYPPVGGDVEGLAL